MDRRMQPLRVWTLEDGEIVIEQEQGHEDISIHVTPEQVPVLIKWLEEAAAEGGRVKAIE